MRCILFLALTGVLALSGRAAENSKTIPLFNGRNLDGWYTYTVETKYENPGIFTVQDGLLKIGGGKGDLGYFGGIITRHEFENYRLVLEYKWGGPTYGKRKDRARDSGLLLHCVGPNGPGPWMTSYELQIIEGGTGDILVVNATGKDNAGKPVTLKLASEGVVQDKQTFFKPGSPPVAFTNHGRLNWMGRDPAWKDEAGFRGKNDVESRLGQWTHVEAICKGDTLTYYVNGQLVNQARGLSVTKGKILVQTEGAEVWYRKIELTPLE